MDVPSPIDFLRSEDATAWAEGANLRRPWRADVFAAIVEELRALGRPSPSVLELGSGPGYLAEAVHRELPEVCYTLLDFSTPMHDLARARLGPWTTVRFVTADFRRDDWSDNLGSFDAVVTVQAVHELRHKARAVGLHKVARRLLRPHGVED